MWPNHVVQASPGWPCYFRCAGGGFGSGAAQHYTFGGSGGLNMSLAFKGKPMKTLLAALLVSISVIAPHELSAQNLLKNGSFEVNGYNYWTLSSGGLVNLGPGSGVNCADGNDAVGLSWQSTLYQSIPTVAGHKYDFYFYLADWGPDAVPANVVQLSPSFGDLSLGTVSFSGSGHTYQNMGWEKFDYSVIADSTTTQVTFYNPAAYPADARWPMIDDVSVTPIPEPSVVKLAFLSACVLLYKFRSPKKSPVPAAV